MDETYKKVRMACLSSIAPLNAEENKVIIDGLTRYGGVGQPNLKFIKVNVDCWEHIFDLLSLRDILAMSETCQRMRQICGNYYRENFYGTRCIMDDSDRLRLSNTSGFLCDKCIHGDFSRFIDTFSLESMKDFQIFLNQNLWRSLTTIDFCGYTLIGNQLWSFTNILNNLENVQMMDLTVEDHSLGKFLALSPKLKCLRFDRVRFKPEALNSVFQNIYPMLTDFQSVSTKEPFPPLTRFLQRNSSIKHLRIGYRELWKIPFSALAIQLDCLSIYLYENEIDVIKLANELKSLHANGFYKSLHLFYSDSIFSNNELFMNEMATCSALKLLYINIYDEFPKAMVNLTNIKELHLRNLSHDIDLSEMTAAARSLINLELLWIEGTVDQFLPFVQYSRKLKFAILGDYQPALDVSHINEVREKSGIRCKLLIGVPEWQYLAAKWNTKRPVYDLIEITRMEKIQKQFDHFGLHMYDY